jgi:hypothetical protein
MVMITATCGKENFPGVGTSQFHVFFVPTSSAQGSEVHLGVQSKKGAYVTGVGFQRPIPAAVGMREELGKWTHGTYDVDEGIVLKAFCMKKTANVSSASQFNQLIRVRARAAHRRLSFPTLGWSRGAFASVSIEGRFDLLTLDEARRIGVTIPMALSGYYSGGMRPTMFEEFVLEPQIEALPTVQEAIVRNSEGREVVVPVTRRRRALDL